MLDLPNIGCHVVDVDIDHLPARTRSSEKRRTTSRRRRWGPGTILLAVSLTLLVGLGVTSLRVHQASRRGQQAEVETEPAPRPTVRSSPAPETRAEPPLNRLVETPASRPVPAAVNAFLESEYDRNAARCLQLADEHQLAVIPSYSVSLLEPQWDHRTREPKVLWFYVYEGATWKDRILSVFGAVDETGQSLFQYPRTEGDPLAVLESQYDGFQWVALDSPEISLIVAMIEATREHGAVLDFFLVKSTPDHRADFWRFSDQRSPEEPPCGAEMCALVDVDGDGYRDLASLIVEAGTAGMPSQPQAGLRPFDPRSGSYPQAPKGVTPDQLATLLALYEKKDSGDARSDPVFWRPPALPAALPEEGHESDADTPEGGESEE